MLEDIRLASPREWPTSLADGCLQGSASHFPNDGQCRVSKDATGQNYAGARIPNDRCQRWFVRWVRIIVSDLISTRMAHL